MAELVYAHDLKSCLERDVGSTPTSGTLNELKGFERNKEWALRSNAHSVSPVFAKEFKEFWVAPPSAGRTGLFWRRRFEPKISLAVAFFSKRLLSLAILTRFEATFIHSFIGSSQSFCFCSIRAIFSSSDFFSKRSFVFLTSALLLKIHKKD